MRAMSQCHPNNLQWADSKSGLGPLSSSIPREDCGFAGLTSASQLTLQFCSVKTWQVSTKTLLPWICEHGGQSSELNEPDVYGCAFWWCNGVLNEVLKTDCEEHTAVRASNHISKPYPTLFFGYRTPTRLFPIFFLVNGEPCGTRFGCGVMLPSAHDRCWVLVRRLFLQHMLLLPSHGRKMVMQWCIAMLFLSRIRFSHLPPISSRQVSW